MGNLKCPVYLVDCELTDPVSVDLAIQKVKPDRIFHLAAQSDVALSWKAPGLTLDSNVQATVNLLEAASKHAPGARILLAGSSEEYGYVAPEECPITEDQPLRPMSPYAVSKVATDFLGQVYFRSYHMHIVITRAFNHTGPRRGQEFVTSSFAKQLAMIYLRQQPPVIHVGNLESFRDWTDVRDTVKAYWLALDKCEPGTPYNIASGHAYKIRDMLNFLLDVSNVRPEIVQDPNRMRPADVPLLLGDATKLENATGWKPTILFMKTLRDLFDYWVERLSK